MTNNQAGYAPQPVPLGSTVNCRNGRVAINVAIDFALGASFKLDLSQIQSQGSIDSVQTLYIDNRANTVNLTAVFGLTNQRIDIPGGAQGYIPVLEGNPPVMVFSVASGTPVVNVQCLNFFVPPYLWFTAGLPIVDLTLAAVIQNGAVNVNANPNTVVNPTDGSGTITAGGTRQPLFVANPTRKRWLLSNPSTATEVLQFSYVSNTGGLIDLPPGTTWNEADLSTSGDEVWVVAATTAHAFTAYAW